MRSAPVRRRLALGVGLVLALSGTAGSLPAQAGTQAGTHAGTAVGTRWAGAVDTTDREAVQAAYWSEYDAGLALPTGWTGSVAGCTAGSPSEASRLATLRALNYARSLGGLAPVTFSAALNDRAQRSALIMEANRSLSHAPPSSWRCWTSAGAANAGRANLALSYPSLTSAGLVGQYLTDAGSANTAVGHRRWVMNPFATVMGSGSTTSANALTVIGPTSASRPNPAYVSWPTSGWFPSTIEPAGRWSVSAGDGRTRFGRARVAVYRDGTRIPATRLAPQTGYARPTLVWRLGADVARSGTFRVVVSNIGRTGTTRRSTTSYTVRMFSPTR